MNASMKLASALILASNLIVVGCANQLPSAPTQTQKTEGTLTHRAKVAKGGHIISLNKRYAVDYRRFSVRETSKLSVQDINPDERPVVIESIVTEDTGKYVAEAKIALGNNESIGVPVPEELQKSMTVEETLRIFNSDDLQAEVATIKAKVEAMGSDELQALENRFENLESSPTYAIQGQELGSWTIPVYLYLMNTLNASGMWWWSQTAYWAWVVIISGAWGYAWYVDDNSPVARQVAYTLFWVVVVLQVIGGNPNVVRDSWNNSSYVQRYPDARIYW